MVILRSTKSLFLLISTCIVISVASRSPQCCPPGFSLNLDRVRCVSGDKEVQVEGMDRCKGEKEVVEARHTTLLYHGSKFKHMGSYSIWLYDCSGLLYQDKALPPGQFCLSGKDAIVCSSCLSGLCIKQCCPPGQVRREDQAWREARCIRWEGGQVASLGGIFVEFNVAGSSHCVCSYRVTTG